MNALRDYHTKLGQSDRERKILHDNTHTWNLKNSTEELVYKTETDPDIENKFTVTTGEGGERDHLRIWD